MDDRHDNRRKITRAYPITPESTPMKTRCTRRSGVSSRLSDSRATPSRHLPRKPPPPPPSLPEPLESEKNGSLNHPVDFVIDLIAQSLYQRLYLKLTGIAQEGSRVKLLTIYAAIRKISIFSIHLAMVLKMGFCVGFHAVYVIGRTAYSTPTRVMELMHRFRTSTWSGMTKLCWNALRNQFGSNKETIIQRSTDASPLQCEETTYSTPCGRRNGCPPSPRSLRKPRHTSFRPPSRSRTRISLPVEVPLSPMSTPRASLGNRAEDLRRILADCNQMQLESAGNFVRNLQARADARAGWRI